jgi:hypothetical protein
VKAASIALLALIVGLWAGSACAADQACVPDPPGGQTAKYLRAQPGDLIEVELGNLYPTQAVLGLYEVYYTLGRYQAGKDAINKRFDDWCEANGQEVAQRVDAYSRLDDPLSFSCKVPVGNESQKTIDLMKTAVIGRSGRLYLVDGHHTFTSFIESPDGGPHTRVRVRVLDNLSKLETDPFWSAMQASGWVWLFDEKNQPITVQQLPTRLGLENFSNDDYRGLIYFTRDISYTQNATNANYQEFHWGAWLRNNKSFDLGKYDLTRLDGFLAAVKDAGTLMSAQADSVVIDPPLTAADLGRIAFKTSEYTKASVDYCQAKPGKPAYANYYYHNVLGNPPLLKCP